MLGSTARSLREMLPYNTASGEPWRLVHYIGDIRSAWDGLQMAPPVAPPPGLNLTKEQIEIASSRSERSFAETKRVRRLASSAAWDAES